MPQLLTWRQVSERTGLCRATIYKRVAEGDLPAPVKIGPRSIRWFSGEIDQWLASLPRVNGPKTE